MRPTTLESRRNVAFNALNALTTLSRKLSGAWGQVADGCSFRKTARGACPQCVTVGLPPAGTPGFSTAEDHWLRLPYSASASGSNSAGGVANAATMIQVTGEVGRFPPPLWSGRRNASVTASDEDRAGCQSSLREVGFKAPLARVDRYGEADANVKGDREVRHRAQGLAQTECVTAKATDAIQRSSILAECIVDLSLAPPYVGGNCEVASVSHPDPIVRLVPQTRHDSTDRPPEPAAEAGECADDLDRRPIDAATFPA